MLIGIILTAAVIGIGAYFLPGLPKSKVSIVLDKAEYQSGEMMNITVINISDETLEFPNLAYGLEFDRKIDGGWTHYLTIISGQVLTYLKPGENVTISYTLGADTEAPFPAGTYRVGIRKFGAYAEFTVKA